MIKVVPAGIWAVVYSSSCCAAAALSSLRTWQLCLHMTSKGSFWSTPSAHVLLSFWYREKAGMAAMYALATRVFRSPYAFRCCSV